MLDMAMLVAIGMFIVICGACGLMCLMAGRDD